MVRGKKYWIGNISGKVNGYCLWQHLHGIVIEVYVDAPAGTRQQYWYRPRPQPIFKRVTALLAQNRWREAQDMCEGEAVTEAE